MESSQVTNLWFEFSFYSYFIMSNEKSFSYEYCMVEGDKNCRAILVYQGDRLVAEFFYKERLPRGYKTILKFLEENLQFIGGNNSER